MIDFLDEWHTHNIVYSSNVKQITALLGLKCLKSLTLESQINGCIKISSIAIQKEFIVSRTLLHRRGNNVGN